MLRLGAGELLLDLALVGQRGQARARSCCAARPRRCRRRPSASSARAPAPAGSRAPARACRRRGRAPRPACRRCTRAAARAWPAPPPRSAPPAPRSRPSARPSPCRAPPARPGFDRRRSLASITMRPRAGPLQASSDTTMSPTLPVASRHVADRLGVVALGGARSRRPPRRPPPRSCAPWRCRARARPRPPRASPSRRAAPGAPSAARPASAAARAGWRPSGWPPRWIARTAARLEVGQRVALVGRRELAHQVLARLGERLGHRLAHAVLHRDRAAVAEAPLELLGELAVVLAEHVGELLLEELGDRARLVGELLLDVLRGLLELGLDELGVGARLLAVEHARADLDGVADDLDRVVAVLLALAHEPDGAFVLDDEAVDDEPVADRADVRLSEWGGGFHVEPPTVGPGPDGTAIRRCSQASGKTFGVCPG